MSSCIAAREIWLTWRPDFSTRLRHEVLHQLRDVARAALQLRHVQHDHVQAIVEILAELALGDGLLEVHVRGGDDAHVRLEHARVTHRRVLARLQHAQQLDLQRQRQLADLVQKQRALLGDADPAELGDVRR